MEDALVETGVFGAKAVEPMMNGSHYIRSLRRIIFLQMLSIPWHGKPFGKQMMELTLAIFYLSLIN